MKRAWVGVLAAANMIGMTQGCGAKSPPATAAAASPTPAATSAPSGPMTVSYRWGGGFSIYQWYEMDLTGDDTAQVKFTVKPVRGEMKTVTDTLDSAQWGELKRLFDQVGFDQRTSVQRKGMAVDIGSITIKRELGGVSHEISTGPQMTTDQDIGPLSKWFDERIRTYLAKAGATAKGQ